MHAVQDHYTDPILDSMLSCEILIDNRDNSNTHEDYQVELEITKAHLFFSKQDGLRFVNENLQVIDHWNESFPGAEWLEVPKIVGSAICPLRMLAGDPSAGSSRNGDSTFEFFDDYNGVLYDRLYDFVAVKPQERYFDNPILEQGTSGQWDDVGIRDNSLLTDQYGDVVIESGKYIVYYAGCDGTDRHIGRAEFERPAISTIQSMTKNANNPLLSPSDMGWSDGKVVSPCPIKKGTSDYIMYFCAKELSGWAAVYYATSTDGISWTPNTTPILTAGNHNLTMVQVRQIQYGANAGKIVLYVEYDGDTMYHATSANWTSGWSWDSGNPIITKADISWASTAGPCNPKFIELEADRYIMGMNAKETNHLVGFMKSTSLNSDWEDYGKVVLGAGSSGQWDDTRIESGELVKDDIGGALVGMFYFGTPTADAWVDGAIGYTTIDQEALRDIFDPAKWQYGTVSGGGIAQIVADGARMVLKLDKDGTATKLNLWAKKGGSLFSIKDLAFYITGRWTGADQNVFHIFRALNATEYGGNESYAFEIQEENSFQLKIDNRYAGVGHAMGVVTDLNLQTDTYYKLKGKVYNDASGHPYLYGTVNSKEIEATDTNDKHVVAGYLGLQVYKADNDAYFDNICICKYTSPAPTVEVGVMI